MVECRASRYSKKSRLVIVAVLILAVILLFPKFSQAVRLDPESADDLGITERILETGEGYSAFLYDNSNGLPTSEANDIVQTSDGFIWIGSYSGLIRYDGNNFERIDSTTGIASVVCLFVDSHDRLWIGTNDSGMAVMEGDSFRMFGKAEGLNSLSVRSIVEDHQGNIYAATTAGIAVIDPDMNVSLIDDVMIRDAYVKDLSVGPDDRIYCVTIDGDLIVLQNKARVSYYGTGAISDEAIRTVMADPDTPGRFYVGTKQSKVLLCELGSTTRVIDTTYAGPLYSINRLRLVDGRLWICADNGIGIMQNGSIQIIDNIPVNSSVEEMVVDYQGNIWFASGRQGVMKIVKNRFTDVFDKYDIPDAPVNTTCIYNNMMFVGKDDGLTVIASNGTISTLPVTSAHTASGEPLDIDDLIDIYDGVKIRSILCDSQNRLWICSFSDNALIRYDNGEVTRFNTEDGFLTNRVRMIYERHDGSFAVAYTGGAAIIAGDSVVKKYDVYSGIGESDVLTISETSDCKLLLGTDGGGIYVVDNDDITHLCTDDGLSSDVIMRIKADEERGLFWIVTSNSIAYMDESYNITTINQFPYSNNFDLYENNNGDMWILSSNGIYVVSIDELIANGEIDPVYYGMANGLPCIATANSYSALEENGDLYISGSTGVAKVNIDEQEESVDSIKISLPYVDADGVRIFPNADGVISIPSSAKKVTFCCYVFTYSLSNPDVIYYLDGFDSETVTVARDQFGTVDYTNLKGGNYRFAVSLCDSHGRMSEEVSFYIVKEKKLTEMWWFRILMSLLFMAAVGLCVAFYIRKRTEKFREKEEHDRLLIREMTEAVANTIDMKDKYTKGHSTRVAEYTELLAKEMGYSKDKVNMYYNIALLHDIGKIGIPPEVLNKAGKLTDNEFMMIKSHAKLGYRVLKHITIVPELAQGAKSHHERPDGHGYPEGLVGDQIPPVARIIAVADTFDAMYSDRPYRKRMDFDKVVSIITEVRGTQLDNDVVDAFLRLVEKGEIKKAEDDDGHGSTEDINNIHKRQDKEAVAEAKSAGDKKPEENKDDKSSDKK